MEMRFARRMDGFEPGIFNVLDEKKNQRMAQGRVKILQIRQVIVLLQQGIVDAVRPAQVSSTPCPKPTT